jgi:hypothetical protein
MSLSAAARETLISPNSFDMRGIASALQKCERANSSLRAKLERVDAENSAFEAALVRVSYLIDASEKELAQQGGRPKTERKRRRRRKAAPTRRRQRCSAVSRLENTGKES